MQAGSLHVAVTIPAGEQQRLLAGTWDALGMLMGGAAAVARKIATLPYLNGFKSV